MTRLHHINCGTLFVPGFPTVVCHCLLLEDEQGLALVDTGIGLEDVRNPAERVGQELIEMAGFQLNESDTAVRRIESLGFQTENVRHIVLTHCDPDHVGGLADFPNAYVHVADEELQHVFSGHSRYVTAQFEHQPNWKTYPVDSEDWFGLEARTVKLGFSSSVLLLPLFGHTLGHCGVAIQQGKRWLLHAGDAYYLKAELSDENHPVSELAAQRADSNELRLANLKELRRLAANHCDEIDIIGYHDIHEMSPSLQASIPNVTLSTGD